MKKVLENDLISLAHRILKMRGKANVEQLKEEAGFLYEKLVLLDFADKHFDGLQPTIGKEKFKQSIADQFEVEREHDRYPDGTEYNPEAISEPNTEKIKDIVSQMPPETEEVDGLVDRINHHKHQENHHNRDNISGISYDDLPDFEPADNTQNHQTEKEDIRPDEQKEQDYKPKAKIKKQEPKSAPESQKKIKFQLTKSPDNKKPKEAETRKKSLNNKLVNDLKLGLNNQIAFTKHLFDGNKDALKQCIQNINKCDSFPQAKHYIDQVVKPHYNSWKGKEEYEDRFINLVENKFSE